MQCPNCGKTIPRRIRYCAYCGRAVQPQTAYTAKGISKGQRSKRLLVATVVLTVAGILLLLAPQFLDWKATSQPALRKNPDQPSRDETLWSIIEKKDETYSVAFSPDGNILALGSRDGNVRLYRIPNGELLHTLVHDEDNPVRTVAFSPDGAVLASGTCWDWERDEAGSIKLWNVSRAEVKQTLNPFTGPWNSYHSLVFSPDGDILAMVGSGSAPEQCMKLWNIPEESPLHLEEPRVPLWLATSVAFSPDGKILAIGSVEESAEFGEGRGGVSLWSITNGSFLYRLNQSSDVHSLAFSPDGTLLASGAADGLVRIWQASAGAKLLHSLAGHKGVVRGVAFSPDGNIVASGATDCTVRLWNVSNSQCLRILETESEVDGVTFSPSGNLLVSRLRDRRLRAWELQ